jgi:IclR family transcriptional regulator, negative regulator of allantoin and glyoxylate utilization operons
MKSNESVSRAIDIINLIAASADPLTLTEISKRINIPKTSAFGILHTLVEKRVLEVADENTKAFKLGIGLFESTLTALSSTDLLKAARPLIEDLNRLTGETVLFAVEDSGDMVFLDKVEGNSIIRATIKLGARVHLHCSAIGKAVLAALPEPDLLAFLQAGPLSRMTEHTIVSRADLLKNLAATRARGHSIDDQENVLDVLCVGAPIYSRQRKVIAGISITMQASKVDGDKASYFGALINSTALKLSRRMGFSESILYWDREDLQDDKRGRDDRSASGETPKVGATAIER